MRWSRLLITTALSLFVIFGLIDAINAQRGSVRFDRQRSLSSSSSRPWTDDTVLLESEENHSRSNARRRIPTSQSAERSSRTFASRTRSRPTTVTPYVEAQSQETGSSEEDFGPRRTTKEQYAPSLRTEVVYQNEFERGSSKGSEETVQQRRKTRLRGGSSTTPSTVVSLKTGRKLGARGGSGRFSNEVEETVPNTSARSIEGRSRGRVKAAPKEQKEDVASEENYPEEFKKLLKAKYQEDSLKNVYTNKLDSSTEGDFVRSNENKGAARFKVKVLSTTTEGSTTTVRVITPRPIRKYSSSSSEESNVSTRASFSRNRPSSFEESSEVSRPRSRTVSTSASSVRSSQKLVTPRSRPSATTSATTTTTTELTTTEDAITTPRPTRAYSRRPSIVSQLTSTTTTSTTTRRPYSPAPKSSVNSRRTTFSTTSPPTKNIADSESKRDNSFVVSSLRNPSAFRSASSPRHNRKPNASKAELNNELKPTVSPFRAKVHPPLSSLKRSQSSTGSRVPNRFESNLKKTPVYTPTIPSIKATPPTTTPTQLTGYDDTNWDWPSATEPAGLFNRLPPPSSPAYNHHHQHPTSGSTRWPSLAVAPVPSTSTTAYYEQHRSPVSASDYYYPLDDESSHQTRPAENKNPNDLEHHRVFVSSSAIAVDVDVDKDGDAVVEPDRMRTNKKSDVSSSLGTRQKRRRGARRFTNRMRNDSDYYIASSLLSSVSSS